MDRLIYTAMTGANAASQLQFVLANNMANASTNGFRSELTTYRSVPLQGPGASTRVFSLEATSGYNNTPGPAQRTNNTTDVMAEGNAWFAVQGLDGTEAYTRNGSLQVSTTGQLVNSTGLPILSDGGAPIDVPPNSNLTVGNDGTISAVSPGQPSTTLAKLKLATPTPDDPLKRGADGLFRPASGQPMTQDPTAKVQTGVLEGSNVNSVEAMVGMIQTARQFENNMKLMTTAESDDKAASQLLSVQG
jgi:flagellar basal-body rod protein FlgF